MMSAPAVRVGARLAGGNFLSISAHAGEITEICGQGFGRMFSNFNRQFYRYSKSSNEYLMLFIALNRDWYDIIIFLEIGKFTLPSSIWKTKYRINSMLISISEL